MVVKFLSKKTSQKNKYRHELIELIHFTKTPLASIKIGGGILKDALPILIDAYNNQQKSDVKTSINDQTINKLMLLIENMLLEANRISTHINNIEIK